MPVKSNPEKCKVKPLILSTLLAFFPPLLLIGLELFNYKEVWDFFFSSYIFYIFSSSELLIGFTSGFGLVLIFNS